MPGGAAAPPGWGQPAAQLPGKAACLAPASPGGVAAGEERFKCTQSPGKQQLCALLGVAREGAGPSARGEWLQLSSGREKSTGKAFFWLMVSYRGLC